MISKWHPYNEGYVGYEIPSIVHATCKVEVLLF